MKTLSTPRADGKGNIMPLYWDKLVLPYCRDLNIEDETFLKFYESSKPRPTELGAKILKIMEEMTSNSPF